MTAAVESGERPAPVVLDAFVSYSRRDTPRVMEIVAAARARGRTMWVDTDDIPAGAPWRTELGTAIEAANAVVCCISPAWLASNECQNEYRRALELGKRLIPVQLCAVDRRPEALGALHWLGALDGEPPESVAAAVLAAVDVDPDGVREHTHWLARALRWDGRERDRSLLLRGRDLRAAEEWLVRAGTKPSPVPLQTELIAASRTAERRRLRTAVAVTATALVVTLVLGLAAVVQWREAVRQRDQAQSRALAAAALAQIDVDPERSLLLARAAVVSAPTDQAVAALRTSLNLSRVRARVAAHPDSVSQVVWSADGRTVITAGAEGTVAAWDALTGAARGRIAVGTGVIKSLSAATNSPVGVAIGDGGRLILWELDRGTGVIANRTELTSSGTTAATISADGGTVVAGTADGTALLLDASGIERRVLRWATSAIDSVALSADGRTVLLGTTTGTAVVGPWDMEKPARYIDHHEGVWRSQLSVDGSVALTESDDGVVSVRRVSDGSEAIRYPGSAFQVAMDPVGRHLIVSSATGWAYLVAADGSRTELLTGGPVGVSVGFSPDGSLGYVGRSDGVVSIWRVADGSQVVELRGSVEMALHVALSRDGQHVVSGTGHGEIRTWALPESPLLLPVDVEPGSTTRGTSVAFTPDGDGVLTAAQGGHVRTWDSRTGTETPLGPACATPPVGAHCLGSVVRAEQGEWITRARYGPGGATIATSGQNGTVIVWDAATAEEVVRAPNAAEVVDDFAFFHDGRALAVGDRSGRTRIIDTRNGGVLAELKDGDSAVFAVAVTLDGHVLTGDEEGTVRMWDVASRTSRIMVRTGRGVFGLDVDDKGQTAAVAGDSEIVLLDLIGSSRPRTITGHSGFVSGIAFARGGAMVVSGGQDGTVRVWEVGTGQQVTSFDMPDGDVNDVSIDGTGRRIAAVSDGGAGAIFDCVVCGSPDELTSLAARNSTRELTADERATFALPAAGS